MDRLSPACETEPCAVYCEQIRLELPTEVSTKLDALETINTGREDRGDCKGLRHFYCSRVVAEKVVGMRSWMFKVVLSKIVLST